MKKTFTILSVILAGMMYGQVTTNLKLDMDFEGGIVDSSINSHTTAISGTVNYGADRWSNANSAAGFGGNTTPGSINLTNDNGNFKVSYPATISLWTSLTSYGSPSSPLITTEDHGTNYSGLWVEVLPTGAILASYGNGGPAGGTSRKSAQTAAGVIALNTWYHIVAVYRSSSVIDIYVNGFKKSSTMSGSAFACAYNLGSGTPGKIGGYYKGSTNKTLDGFIDKVKIFDAALTQNQIWALYYNSHNNRSRLIFDFQIDGNIADSSTYNQSYFPSTTVVYDNDRFNAANSAIAISSTSNIILDDVHGNFKCLMPITFSTWIKVNSYGNGAAIFCNEDASFYTGFWVQLLGTGQLAVSIGDGTGTGPSARRTYLTNNSIPNDGQWRHVVVTLVQAPSPGMFTLQVYLNGVLEPVGSGSGSCSGISYANGPIDHGKIGTYFHGNPTASFLDGSLDEVMLWDTLLTANEVTDLYNEQVFNGMYYVGVNEKDRTDGVKIYPNPAKDFLSVKIPVDLNAQAYSVYDITGKILESGVIAKGSDFKLNLKDYSVGVYVLRINSEEEVIVQKFIKD